MHCINMHREEYRMCVVVLSAPECLSQGRMPVSGCLPLVQEWCLPVCVCLSVFHGGDRLRSAVYSFVGPDYVVEIVNMLGVYS